MLQYAGPITFSGPGPLLGEEVYNFELFKPHFYIVKLGFTGVYIVFFFFVFCFLFFFLISARKHRIWF